VHIHQEVMHDGIQIGSPSSQWPAGAIGCRPSPAVPLIKTVEELQRYRLGASVAERQLRPWREPVPHYRARFRKCRGRACPG
jgi:hypothetical protein